MAISSKDHGENGFSSSVDRKGNELYYHSILFYFVNDKPYGMVHPSCGICEGDPLSPYLFLLCAGGFMALLAKAELEGRISGVYICRGAPRVTNLLFANDSMLFC